MKTIEEIQRAHDLLHALVTGAVEMRLVGRNLFLANGNLDVLCWVLGHEHNTTFAENLVQLREMIGAAGFREALIPTPHEEPINGQAQEN